jgi:hypothetical protein
VPVTAQQLIVRALLNDAAAIEHNQPIRAGDGRQPMRDGDHGLAGRQRAEA